MSTSSDTSRYELELVSAFAFTMLKVIMLDVRYVLSPEDFKHSSGLKNECTRGLLYCIGHLYLVVVLHVLLHGLANIFTQYFLPYLDLQPILLKFPWRN